MGKGDPKKPRGKMSSYAFFVQTCREEHKKKHPDASVNFSEFSKKCSERWKTMSAKEKGKSEDMAKADKARYEREMKTYIPPTGETKKKFKDPNAPKRPPSAFFLFCSEYRPKIKGEHPGLSIGDVAKKLGEMWNNTAADDEQPYEKKAAKLKEKYEKDVAAHRAIFSGSEHGHFVLTDIRHLQLLPGTNDLTIKIVVQKQPAGYWSKMVWEPPKGAALAEIAII
ncbi:high mobility group protein B1-like [Lepus europaeus]|uniref:high mobility group protein B1-like n=1 Tax=Lepus europaeus TaxID=9983 RepID=UPI002B48E404|nr:high mobility group protein B1-like [Lepus europaeus]